MRGSITKHKQKNGRTSWGFYFRTGKNANGKWNQTTKQGFGRKSEAEEALRQALANHEAGLSSLRDPRTFAEFFDTWIQEHCERHCEATTTEGYVKKGSYIKRFLGELLITKITPLQIQTAINTLLESGGKNGRKLATKTVREVAAVTNMTFNAAIRWGVIDFNPMVRVTLPRMDKREPKVLEKSQLEWLLDSVEGHEYLHLLLLLSAATGCRRGELLAVRWADIDFELEALSVARSLAQTRAKGLFLKVPKGRKTRRFSIPLSALEALRHHRSKQAERRSLFGDDYKVKLDLVFATPEGDYLKPDSVTAKVSLLTRKLGLPKGVSLHTLRHTHGSHLLSAGIPLPAVSKRLGHANTHITASVYSHALEKDDRGSSDAWERTMGDVGKSKNKQLN